MEKMITLLLLLLSSLARKDGSMLLFVQSFPIHPYCTTASMRRSSSSRSTSTSTTSSFSSRKFQKPKFAFRQHQHQEKQLFVSYSSQSRRRRTTPIQREAVSVSLLSSSSSSTDQSNNNKNNNNHLKRSSSNNSILQRLRNQLRSITGFSFSAFRTTIRSITGVSLTAIYGSTVAITGNWIRQLMRIVLSIFPAPVRYFFQPFLILYYVPFFLLRTVCNRNRNYELIRQHETLVNSWKHLIEIADDTISYWPIHYNTKTNTIEQDINEMNLNDAIAESVEIVYGTNPPTPTTTKSNSKIRINNNMSEESNNHWIKSKNLTAKSNN